MTAVYWMVEKVAWLLGPELVQSLGQQEITSWGVVRLRLADGHAKVVRVPVTGSMRPTVQCLCWEGHGKVVQDPMNKNPNGDGAPGRG